MIKLLSATPAPVLLTSIACHLIAPFFLLRRRATVRTLGHMVKNAIEFEFRLVVTLNAGTGMPEVSALPASGLSTLTSSSICAATEARFAHCFATVWLRTPFQVLVCTDFHVHLDHFVFPIDFLRAKR